MLSSRAVQFSTKTPARTKQRAENAHAYPTTVLNGKINAARTPFQPKTAQPQRILKEIVVKSTNTTTRNRPLADKTPFANRVLESTPQLLFTKPQHDSGGSARASSTRKHPRAPNNAAKKNFQTPANNGNHWDVSDGEIIVPELGPSEAEVVEEDLDDNDPIEYMPPNTTNIAYNPPFDFDLPNYSQLGSQVLRTVYSYPAVEGPPPSFEFEIKENEFGKWNELTSILPPLPESPPPTRPSTRLRSTTGRVTSLSSRPASTLTRPTTATLVRSKAAVGTNTRPATSAGTRAPIAKPTPTHTARAPLTSRTTPTARKPLTNTTTSAKPITKLPSTTTRPAVPRTTLSKPAKPTPTTATITTRKPMITKPTTVKPTPTSRAPLSVPTKKAITPSSRILNLKPRAQVQRQPSVASSSTTRRSTAKGVPSSTTILPPPPSTRSAIKRSGSTLVVPGPGLKKMDGSVMVRKKTVTSSLSSLGDPSLHDKNKNKDDEEKDDDNDNDEKGTVAVESENKFDINRLQEIQGEDDEDEVSMKMEYQHQHQYLEFIREVEFGGDGDDDDEEDDDDEVSRVMGREMNNDNGDDDGDVSVVIDCGGGNGSGSEVESLIEEKELDEDGVLFGMYEEVEEDKVAKVEVKVEDIEEAQDQGQVQMKEVEPEFVEVEDVERVKAVESVETVKAMDEDEDVEEAGDVKTGEDIKEVEVEEVKDIIEEEILNEEKLVNEVEEQALSVVLVQPQSQQLEGLKEEEVHQCEIEVGTGADDKHLESEIEKRVENNVDGEDLSLDGDLDLDVFIDNSLSEKLVELGLSTRAEY